MPASDIIFTPADHTYRLMPQGVIRPSVTQILAATGVATDFDTLVQVVGPAAAQHILARRVLGSAVHADCHAMDDGDLAWDRVHPEVVEYLMAWEKFKADLDVVPLERERLVYNPPMRYAGTLDGIFWVKSRNARRVTIDIKIGDPKLAAARYQTAGYVAAWAHEHPEDAGMERWSVQLRPGDRVPYQIAVYDDWRDFETWRSIVATYYANDARSMAA